MKSFLLPCLFLLACGEGADVPSEPTPATPAAASVGPTSPDPVAETDPAPTGEPPPPGEFQLSSTAFGQDGEIPSQFSCEGEDLSPPLSWSAAPEGTVSLALIVDDPDAPDPAAPQMVWVHWLLYNLPTDPNGLVQGLQAPPESALAGRNDKQETGYHGPCPPIGRHRYFFKLYALDTALPDLGEPDKAEQLAAMEGHLLGETQLMGYYEKRPEE